jgi:hypothetical protein
MLTAAMSTPMLASHQKALLFITDLQVWVICGAYHPWRFATQCSFHEGMIKFE